MYKRQVCASATTDERVRLRDYEACAGLLQCRRWWVPRQTTPQYRPVVTRSWDAHAYLAIIQPLETSGACTAHLPHAAQLHSGSRDESPWPGVLGAGWPPTAGLGRAGPARLETSSLARAGASRAGPTRMEFRVQRHSSLAGSDRAVWLTRG